MKKKFTFLIAALMLLTMIGLPTSTLADNTAGYTPSAALSSTTGSVTGTAGETWSYSITFDNNGYYGYGAGWGWQLGAGPDNKKKPRGCRAFSISTSGITGTITKIEVEAGSYQGNSKINVTVGGSAFGTQNQSTYSGQGALKSTFTGSASGEIIISATDAVRAFYLKSITVTYSAGPTIVVSSTSISGFSYVVGNGPSTPSKTFTVSGSNLTHNLVVTASSNYEISKTSSGAYTNSLEYIPSLGTVSESTVYVRLKADLEAGNYNTEDDKVTLTSEDATSKTIALSGIVKGLYSYDIDFEDEDDSYTDWTFDGVLSQNNTITAYNGDYCGKTNAADPASITTNNTIKKPVSLVCYLSKSTTNTTASTWKVQVSSNGSDWTDVESTSASDMSKGEWKEFSAELSAYSDVYVRVYYSGSTAVRNIDDLSLSYLPVDNYNNLTGNVTIPSDETVTIGTLNIPDGKTLKVSGTLNVTTSLTNNGDEDNLIIEDGGQLITSNAVAATVKKNVEKANNWGAGEYTPDGWYFIALPLNSDEVTPSMLTTGDYDLYHLNPGTATWENYKTHDGNDNPGFTLANGEAYLYANNAGLTVDFAGTVKASAASQNVGVSTGWNLVGNPFTYNTYLNRPYYKLNDDRNDIEIVNNNAAIAPCTGVLVKITTEENVTFTKTDQSVGANNGNINIALAQTHTTRGVESMATLDKAILSFNEGSELPKFYFGTQNANIYIPMDNEEYAIVSTEARGEMPVNFKANQNGQYTITVNAEEVEMGYLHLIDNIAGTDVDLLANPSYTFNAKGDDYESRFRLVFSTTMVNAEMGEDFAFISDGQLVIANVGEAILQVIDVTGRVVANENINGTCSKAISAKAGVYVLRLINGTDVKTQKIVIR